MQERTKNVKLFQVRTFQEFSFTLGSSLLDWMYEHLGLARRDDAMVIADRLIKNSFLQNLKDKNSLQFLENSFYIFPKVKKIPAIFLIPGNAPRRIPENKEQAPNCRRIKSSRNC
jgi:hypothetical protein